MAKIQRESLEDEDKKLKSAISYVFDKNADMKISNRQIKAMSKQKFIDVVSQLILELL